MRVKLVAFLVVKEMNGCRKALLLSPYSSLRLTDQIWLTSAPMVHPFDCFSATPVMPSPHWLGEMPLVEVGIWMTGPTPQISPPLVGALGERNRLCVMLPNPVVLEPSPSKPCRLTTGRMVREITFQLSLIENGITG